MTGETAGDAAGAAARRRDGRFRAGGPGRRCGAAERLGVAAPEPAGDRRRRTAAVARLRRRVRTDAATPTRPTRPTIGRGDRRRRTGARTVAPGDLPTALAAAINDPSRVEVHAGDRIAALEPWLAAQPAVGVGLLLDDPRPRRGSPLALALAGADGRTVAVEGAEDSATLRRLLDRLGVPVVGHEVKPLLVRRIADDPDAPPTPVAFDTQIAAYILNASLRSQTIADVVAEQLDLILPDAAALDAPARAGLEALSALAVREPLERRLVEEGLDRLFREIELPLIAVLARMEATGVALDRDALASSPRSSPPRSRGSRPRSTSTSGTSSTSAAPSSSSRSCSSSSTCPRASGPRPATRPTRRCSRTCARRIR